MATDCEFERQRKVDTERKSKTHVNDNHLDSTQSERGVGESDRDVDEVAHVVEVGGLRVVVVSIPKKTQVSYIVREPPYAVPESQ